MALFRKGPPTSPEPPAQPHHPPTPKVEPAPTRAHTPAPPPPREPQPLAPPPPPPQFLREIDVRTSLGPDAVITGKLSFNTPTRIEGKLKGELRCTQLLIIGPNAVVEGWIKADELQIEGSVKGEIAETRKVEIRATGKFIGQMQTQFLSIRDGGFFDGECRMLVHDSQAARNQASS
jgi:cytoskeletal protein CcmA (bactofilin family)